MASTKSNPVAGGGGARECLQLAGVDIDENNKPSAQLQSLPSRATLARRFPRLRVNRLTGRWIDDATGARGDDVESLRAFIEGGAR